MKRGRRQFERVMLAGRWGLTLALLAACGSAQNETAPAPAPAPRSSGLRPLTSRDTPPGAAPSTAGNPAVPLPPGHPPIGPQAPGAGAETHPASGRPLGGTVTIASKLEGRQGSADALFLIVRSAATHQILAVRKEERPRFPFRFRISGEDAMVAGTPFAGPFDLTARLSKTGDAMPGQGDLEGTAKGVAEGATDLSVALDTVRQ